MAEIDVAADPPLGPQPFDGGVTVGTPKRNDQRLQRCGEGYERTHALIHGEADQKRKAGNRRDRVEGRIESLIQGRVRSRGWDFSR